MNLETIDSSRTLIVLDQSNKSRSIPKPKRSKRGPQGIFGNQGLINRPHISSGTLYYKQKSPLLNNNPLDLDLKIEPSIPVKK